METTPVRIERVKRLWPPWVGARVSYRVIRVREDVHLTTGLVAHELMHILQRERLGARFLLAYLFGWVRGGFRYKHNPLEVEARAAARDPVMRSWAERVIRQEANP